MKELVVLSGKGGTGKTSITASFAALVENVVLCDADVDASDLHLILTPEQTQAHEFEGGHAAIINPEICKECGQCIDLCRFDAIRPDFKVDSIECEGCGVCVDLCPEQAIDFPKTICGHWYLSQTRFGSMVHARLGIAAENSGKLVTLVRQEARKVAETEEKEFILTDGPPGIGCPVVASMSRATGILIVAEPSLSGIHDMKRVKELATHFNMPAMVCINKFDLNPKLSFEIEMFSKQAGIEFVGDIPFDPAVTKAMVKEKSIVEFDEKSLSGRRIKMVWERVWSVLSSFEKSKLETI